MTVTCAGGLAVSMFALSRLGRDTGRIPDALILVLVSFLFYLFLAWASAKVFHGGSKLLIGLALLIRVPFLTADPLLSDDVYRYRWEARVQAAGLNPYLTRPVDPAAAALSDATDSRIPGRDFKSGYGPVVEMAFRATLPLASGPDPVAGARWFKLPAIVGDLALIALLGPILAGLGLPASRLAWYALCPLPAVEFWWSGHFDSLMLALIAAAVLLALRERWAWAFAALGLAVATKYWPLLLFPAFWNWQWRRTSAALAGLVVAAGTFLPYLGDPAGMWNTARFMSGFAGGWRNNDVLFGVTLWAADGDMYRAKYVTFALFAAVSLALSRIPVHRAALLMPLALVMFAANAHPWYFTWLLPWIAVTPEAALVLWIGLAPLLYQNIPLWLNAGEWRDTGPDRWWVHAAPLAWLAVTGVRRLRAYFS